MKKRKLFKSTSLERFRNRFKSDEDCYEYLAEIKWEADGFVCRKCGNTNYCAGNTPSSRRCTRCKHTESVTAGTMFNKLRFSLLTAFRILFDLCVEEDGAPTTGLSEKLGLRQKTVWEFKQKVQQATDKIDIVPLNGTVITDNICVGEQDERIIVALEVLDNGEVGRGYGQLICSYSPDSFALFIKEHISETANVIFSQEKGNESLSQMMDIHINNLRKWLFGVHRHCSTQRLQGYLNEYYFRFNSRTSKATRFDTLISTMVRHQSAQAERP